MSKQVVDRGKIQIHLADEGRIERNGLEFDDNEAPQLQVIEQQIYVEIRVTHFEQYLSPNERKAVRLNAFVSDLAEMVVGSV